MLLNGIKFRNDAKIMKAILPVKMLFAFMDIETPLFLCRRYTQRNHRITFWDLVQSLEDKMIDKVEKSRRVEKRDKE